MEKKAIYEEIGKTLAPVEIDSDEAMELFGITKKDLIPFMVGSSRIMVYPYPAPEEVCREMLRDLRERYGREARDNRCLVAGAYGGLKACPENYSCSACPVGQCDQDPRLLFERLAARKHALDLLVVDHGCESVRTHEDQAAF